MFEKVIQHINKADQAGRDVAAYLAHIETADPRAAERIAQGHTTFGIVRDGQAREYRIIRGTRVVEVRIGRGGLAG